MTTSTTSSRFIRQPTLMIIMLSSFNEYFVSICLSRSRTFVLQPCTDRAARRPWFLGPCYVIWITGSLYSGGLYHFPRRRKRNNPPSVANVPIILYASAHTVVCLLCTALYFCWDVCLSVCHALLRQNDASYVLQSLHWRIDPGLYFLRDKANPWSRLLGCY